MSNEYKRRWAVFTACFLIVLVSFSIRYSYGVLLPEMLPSLGITKTEAGVIYASFFIAYTVFSPLLGLLGDRMDIRWLLTVCMGILGVGTFLMAYSSSVLTASLFYTIVGIGSAATWVPVMALAQKWAADRHRGKTLAIIDIGSAFSLILTSTVLPQVVHVQNWNTAWMAMGVISIIIAIMSWFLVRNPSQESLIVSGHNPSGTPVLPLRSIYALLLRDVRIWQIGLAYLLTGFAVMVPLTFLVTYASEDLAMTYEAAATLVVATGVSAIAGKVILGYISDKIHRKLILILCGLLITGGCVGLAFSSGISLYIFTAIFGAGYGACWAMYAACASDYFPKQFSGIIVGLWTVFLGVGLMLSPVVAGRLADLTGALQWSFIVAGIIGLVSIVFLLPIKKPVPAIS